MISNLSFLSDALFKFHVPNENNKSKEIVDTNHLEERLEENHVEDLSEKDVEERVLCNKDQPFYLSNTTLFHFIVTTNISSKFLEIISPPPEFIA